MSSDDDELSGVEEEEDYYDPDDRTFEYDDDIYEEDDDDDEVEDDDDDGQYVMMDADGTGITITDILNIYMARLRGIATPERQQQQQPQHDNTPPPKIDLDKHLSLIRPKDLSTNHYLFNREILGNKKNKSSGISGNFLPGNKHQDHHRLDSKIFCCQFLNQGDTFMSASQDRVIRFYDTTSWHVKKSINAHDISWSIIDVDTAPNQQSLIYSSWSPYIYLADLTKDDGEDHQRPLDLDPDSDRFCVFGLKFSHDSSEILAGSSAGFFYLYDLIAGRRTAQIYGHTDDVNSVCYLDPSDSNILVTASDDYYIKIWDKRTMTTATTTGRRPSKPEGYLSGHRRGITFVESKGDGRYLLSNGKDWRAKLWDVRTMSTSISQISTTRSEYHNNQDYRFGASGSSALGPTNNEKDLSIMTYSRHTVLQTLIRCHFSPLATTSQRYIYTGSAYGDICIYDVLTGELVDTLKQGRGLIRDLSWAPYSPQLVSTSWEGYISSWDDWFDKRYNKES